MTTELLLLPLGVVVGALTQRITGIGFALVCAPILVLVAGPYEGVVLANLLSLAVNLIVFTTGWRDTEWVKGLLLAVPALLAIPLGAYVARTMPPAPLMVVIGRSSSWRWAPSCSATGLASFVGVAAPLRPEQPAGS